MPANGSVPRVLLLSLRPATDRPLRYDAHEYAPADHRRGVSGQRSLPCYFFENNLGGCGAIRAVGRSPASDPADDGRGNDQDHLGVWPAWPDPVVLVRGVRREGVQGGDDRGERRVT